LYAKTGASGNAYTSFDKTCYLFSCTDNFDKSLEILLDFVQSPYFTQETVEKEQGIIGQEIRMYEDNPGWRVFFNLLDALYINHPVKIDIAGTIDSIAKIDADLLYSCYNTFYNLNNMVLSIAGNFEIETALEVADKMLKQNSPLTIINKDFDEPLEINKAEATQTLPVAMPLFTIGFKAEPSEGIERIKASAETRILLEFIAGESSDLYRQMYEEELINSSFGAEVFSGNGYFSSIFEGESRNPREVQSRIIAEVERLKESGLDKEEFKIIKKSFYGEQLRRFGNVEGVANSMVAAHFDGVSLYDNIEVFANVEFEDVVDRLEKSFNTSRCAISIIEPSKA
ncbi:MAG: insulinase family protein, partial [Clostridiales bacterium]|nr:insulinase family protein [Clostridiales bacterium]